MNFRLNGKHKLKPTGKKRRGARTIAKEKLYKHILLRIRCKANFNPGISTGVDGDLRNRFLMPYMLL